MYPFTMMIPADEKCHTVHHLIQILLSLVCPCLGKMCLLLLSLVPATLKLSFSLGENKLHN